MEILGPELVKIAAILAAMERVSSVPRASGGQVTRLGLGVSIVHLYPSTLSLLNLLTSHSLPFCKQRLYGSYAFAGRKVAFYSRYSFGGLCSPNIAYRRKTSTTLRGKARVRSIFTACVG